MKAGWANWVEGAVLGAEVILLIFFSIPAWSARVDALPAEQQSTVVRVIAEQFAWNAHYPGADGVFGRTDITLVSPDNPLGYERRPTTEERKQTTNGTSNEARVSRRHECTRCLFLVTRSVLCSLLPVSFFVLRS